MGSLNMSKLDLAPMFSLILCAEVVLELELESLHCFGAGKAVFVCWLCSQQGLTAWPSEITFLGCSQFGCMKTGCKI